jgi:uncharacterized iron-regulated protein
LVWHRFGQGIFQVGADYRALPQYAENMNLPPLLVRVIALLIFVSTALSAADVFSGDDGARLTQSQVLQAVAAADIVLLGEVHTDAAGHAWQQSILAALASSDSAWLLSLEEFDRSQQVDLDEFAAGDLSGEALKARRNFVGPGVKEHWLEWNLPKLTIARDADVPMFASNAPLKYSRMARNNGCKSLASLPAAEQVLFACPLAPTNPNYQARFYRTMERMSGSRQAQGMKLLKPEQMARMFRAQRVWDATMADSMVSARNETQRKVVHIVGSFHSDYNGGLVQELRVRDPDARILVVSIRPGRAATLPAADQGRADIMVYRGRNNAQ